MSDISTILDTFFKNPNDFSNLQMLLKEVIDTTIRAVAALNKVSEKPPGADVLLPEVIFELRIKNEESFFENNSVLLASILNNQEIYTTLRQAISNNSQKISEELSLKKHSDSNQNNNDCNQITKDPRMLFYAANNYLMALTQIMREISNKSLLSEILIELNTYKKTLENKIIFETRKILASTLYHRPSNQDISVIDALSSLNIYIENKNNLISDPFLTSQTTDRKSTIELPKFSTTFPKLNQIIIAYEKLGQHIVNLTTAKNHYDKMEKIRNNIIKLNSAENSDNNCSSILTQKSKYRKLANQDSKNLLIHTDNFLKDSSIFMENKHLNRAKKLGKILLSIFTLGVYAGISIKKTKKSFNNSYFLFSEQEQLARRHASHLQSIQELKIKTMEHESESNTAPKNPCPA